MTGLEYITGALQLIGVYQDGEAVPPASSTIGLKWLKAMLGTWSSDLDTIYASVLDTFTLTASDGEYTLGPTGDFVTTSRPNHFLRAKVRDTQNIDHDLVIRPLREYEDFLLKEPGDSLPQFFGYNMTHPNIEVRIWPPPDTADTLRLTSFQDLATATLASEYSVPPGYDNAIQWNLAVILAPVFSKSAALGNPQNPTSIAGMALSLYRGLTIANMRTEGVNLDPMAPGGDYILRSWRSDE